MLPGHLGSEVRQGRAGGGRSPALTWPAPGSPARRRGCGSRTCARRWEPRPGRRAPGRRRLTRPRRGPSPPAGVGASTAPIQPPRGASVERPRHTAARSGWRPRTLALLSQMLLLVGLPESLPGAAGADPGAPSSDQTQHLQAQSWWASRRVCTWHTAVPGPPDSQTSTQVWAESGGVGKIRTI